jgi:hypothetical protein
VKSFVEVLSLHVEFRAIISREGAAFSARE